jgi:hypothetical protein
MLSTFSLSSVQTKLARDCKPSPILLSPPLDFGFGSHGGKNWDAAALVPGRTQQQCCHRSHNALDPSIDRVNGRTGEWAEDEDIKLKGAIQTHGDKD